MSRKRSPEDLIPTRLPNPKELDREKNYRRAFEAYLDYVPINIISKSYSIPTADLITYINSGRESERSWRSIREDHEQQSHREYFATRSSRLNELVNFSIVGIKRALNRTLSRQKVSLKDAKTISEILGTLDKIIRLDERSPTEIIKVDKPASLEEVREFIRMNDPFLQRIEDKIEVVQEAEIVEEGAEYNLEASKDDGND